MQMHNEPDDETRLTSARILPNPLLYVRPSSECAEMIACVQRSKVCPGSVGKKAHSFASWLCVRVCVLANVCAFVCWHICFFMRLLFRTKLFAFRFHLLFVILLACVFEIRKNQSATCLYF